MITPAILDDNSYSDIISNIDKYTDLFLQRGVLVFKKLNLNANEQESITKAFGKKLDWGHISLFDEEDHSFTINTFGKQLYTNNDILIPWHLENSHKNDRQIASTWNMIVLTCDKNSGTTGFVHSSDILSNMDDNWIEFLRKSQVTNSMQDSYNLIDNIPQKPKIAIRPCLVQHRNTGVEIVNVSPRYHQDVLYSVDGLPPSQENFETFGQIKKWIDVTVQSYENNPDHWLTWDLGDLVVVDLTTIFHAVKGGFLIGERKFRRYWAYSSFDSMQRSI